MESFSELHELEEEGPSWPEIRRIQGIRKGPPLVQRRLQARASGSHTRSSGCCWSSWAVTSATSPPGKRRLDIHQPGQQVGTDGHCPTRAIDSKDDSPMSSRKCFVVAYRPGRPGASRWPMTSTQPRSSSCLTICELTVTPDIFDVATGDRLLVSNDGQRFHGGTRILRGLFRVEPIQVRLHIRASLEPPTRGQFTQLDATPTPLRRKLRQPPANVFSADTSLSNS